MSFYSQKSSLGEYRNIGDNLQSPLLCCPCLGAWDLYSVELRRCAVPIYYRAVFRDSWPPPLLLKEKFNDSNLSKLKLA
jgi:hypothetical protein